MFSFNHNTTARTTGDLSHGVILCAKHVMTAATITGPVFMLTARPRKCP